jgi:CRP-like cAMP-binding protein
VVSRGSPLAEQRRLILKLRSIAELDADDEAVLSALPMRVRSFQADEDVVQEGQRPADSVLVLTGFLCRYKLVGDGKRQILSFHKPGDIPDLQSLFLGIMDHNLGTLVPSELAFIAHSDLHAVVDRYPRIAAAFWRDTLVDAAIFREWMVSLGRRSAYQRLAHLVCEMATRFDAVGMAENRTFAFPVTQTELGDALGLSYVHVNRTLMELRADRLIRWQDSTVAILDWPRLVEAADFDPTYLHQDGGRTVR